MSANYFELLKYAATGIAAPDMTYFDRMRASTLMGGVVQNLTGQPPLTFKADGTPLISWSMKGNGQQTGTPTPQNIIMPEFVGAMTNNLFDKDSVIRRDGYLLNDEGVEQQTSFSGYTLSKTAVKSGETYTISGTLVSGTQTFRIYFYSGNSFVSRTPQQANVPYAFTIPDGCDAIAIQYIVSAVDFSTIMINLGSTALDYEPYGYKIPITCAGQTVPVYLGQTQTVRRVKKLVLDGTDNYTWYKSATRPYSWYFYPYTIGTVQNTPFYCTHGKTVTSVADYEYGTVFCDNSVNFGIFPTTITSVSELHAYLSAQYAAGHPVTIWYVLAEPTTGIINEPLAKIGSYADELHSTDAGVSIPTVKGNNTLTVETDLQPSEVSITGHIKAN